MLFLHNNKPPNYMDLVDWRWDTLLTKEPETIAWLDTLQPGDVLVDGGANIGLYATYAAKIQPEALIIAIEPHPINVATMYQIIEGLPNVFVINACLTEHDVLGHFLLPEDNRPGNAGGVFNDHKLGINPYYLWPGSVITQGLSLDSIIMRYCSRLPWPTHIKLDIDDGTIGALKGMGICLLRGNFKSLLVEVTDNILEEAVRLITSYGLLLDEQLMSLPDHSNHRRKADPNNHTKNLIFKKG